MTPRDSLRPARRSPTAIDRLARHAGILPSYVDNDGRRRYTSDATRERLLTALGYDVSSEAAARRALEEIRARGREPPVPPVCVTPSARARTVDMPGMPGATRRVYRRVEAEWILEDGTRRDVEVSVWRGRRGGAELRLGDAPPPGYHRLRVRLDDQEIEQLRIVAPDRAYRVQERVGRQRVFGLVANLYAVRSRANWGVGDLGDLEKLIELCANAGGDFVGFNPLHALRNRGNGISPYSPISRLFRNPIYIDVSRVPELQDSPETQAYLESPAFRQRVNALRASDRVDYPGVLAVKLAALERLHAVFNARHRASKTARARDFAAYVERMGEPLVDFATFLALEQHFHDAGEAGWPAWPPPFRDPRSREVVEFRAANERTIDLHCWIQFELDRQLAAAGAAADRSGLRIGLYADLALGSAWNGSDVWGFPGLFVEGVSIGAPPDEYSAIGQDWALPPMHPHRLRESGYRYWILLIRNALAHAGALRLDHVMGLFRQFWIPAGETGTAGAYVRYPGQDLLGILALESRRARAIIIGEDLGTVPRGLPRILEQWGILSSRVLYFERDRRGRFRPSARYSNRALVTVNTHDHAPLAGYLAARDLHLRRALGTLPQPEFERALKQRAAECAELTKRLRAERLLPADTKPDDIAHAAAAHRFLARTPAPLLGVSVDDLTGETEPINVPGVAPERHPNWTRKLRIEIEQLAQEPRAVRILEAVSERARPLFPQANSPRTG